MKKIILTLTIMSFVFSISLAQEELTKDNRKTIKEAVEKRSHEFWKLFTKDYNDENYEKIIDFFVDSDDAAWMGKPAMVVLGEEIVYTNEENNEKLKNVFTYRTSTPAKLIENYFAVLASEVVVEVISQELYVIAKDGQRFPENYFSSTFVWVLDNGNWKVLHWHRSKQAKE